MTGAAIYLDPDGTARLDWPDDARTVEVTREVLEAYVALYNVHLRCPVRTATSDTEPGQSSRANQ